MIEHQAADALSQLTTNQSDARWLIDTSTEHERVHPAEQKNASGLHEYD